jgi:hypothetical protein
VNVVCRAIYPQFLAVTKFCFRLPGCTKPGLHMFGPHLTYADGVFTVHPGFVWDGNSLKIKLGPIVIGVSDGSVKANGEPLGKWPSCGHDAIYGQIWQIAAWLGIPVETLRLAVDEWFRDRWAAAGAGETPELQAEAERTAKLYFPVVRVVGWWLVRARKPRGDASA